MSLIKNDRLSLIEYIDYTIKIISNNKSTDVTSRIDSFKENVKAWINDYEKKKDKIIIEVFSIIRYLIINKKIEKNSKNLEIYEISEKDENVKKEKKKKKRN